VTRALLRLPAPGLLALVPVIPAALDVPAHGPASAPPARGSAAEQLGLL
jgi:hypothetical protein